MPLQKFLDDPQYLSIKELLPPSLGALDKICLYMLDIQLPLDIAWSYMEEQKVKERDTDSGMIAHNYEFLLSEAEAKSLDLQRELITRHLTAPMKVVLVQFFLQRGKLDGKHRL